MEIEFEYRGQKIVVDLESLAITGYQDLELLNNHISLQPSLYAWYSSIAEELKNDVEGVKDKLDLALAEAELKIRRTGVLGVTKLTESSIQSAVATEGAVITAKTNYLKKKRDYGAIRSIVDGLAQRKDMLATLSANLRHELKNDY